MPYVTFHHQLDIEKVFNNLTAMVGTGGIFDDFIRATEWYLHNDDAHKIEEMKKLLKLRRRNNPIYKPTDEEMAVLDSEKRKVFYRIDKNPVDYIPVGSAMISFFNQGAIIHYSSKGSYLEQYLAVAHEVGHILFHTDKERNGYRVPIKENNSRVNEVMEAEASYFAELTMLWCADQYDGREVFDGRRLTKQHIVNAIKLMYHGYDPNIIGSLKKINT